jgi:hypothetical protein
MTTKTNHPLEQYVTLSAKAGMPADQVRNFVSGGYVAFPWALGLHAASREADKQGGPVMIGCGGARGPGKSHAIMAQVVLKSCSFVKL